MLLCADRSGGRTSTTGHADRTRQRAKRYASRRPGAPEPDAAARRDRGLIRVLVLRRPDGVRYALVSVPRVRSGAQLARADPVRESVRIKAVLAPVRGLGLRIHE